MIPNVTSSLSPMAGLDPKDPKSVAARVQDMFVEVMLKSMEDSVDAEDGMYGNSSSSEIYRGMFREKLADSLGTQLSPLQEQLQQGIEKVQEHASKVPTSNTQSSDGLPVSGVITSPVGWRQDPFTGEKRFHSGTDIAAPAGTPIEAVADGTVVESGAKGTYGNAVVVKTDDGRRMLYAHNQQNFVRVGDRVIRGDAIALVGSTGRATGPHVHFEVSE